MKITMFTLSLLGGIAAGCTTVPPAPLVSLSQLPNCFDTNYDREKGLFTMRNEAGNAVNQQCLLTVRPRGEVASASRLAPGRYRVYLSDGGGGGAGGNRQSVMTEGGGGGGGGAGAREQQAAVNLTEGLYKLTLGAGGPGGSACVSGAGFGGGPGWIGSPSNMIRVVTGELVMGTPGADTFVRPTRAQNDRNAGKSDGHGGSGPGQTTGGGGAVPATKQSVEVQAQAGGTTLASGRVGLGGAPGEDVKRSGSGGGGGGATSMGQGGGGGGESPGQKENPPQRGTLGSGGGGGEGSLSECDPGARGGNGYIAFRPI